MSEVFSISSGASVSSTLVAAGAPAVITVKSNPANGLPQSCSVYGWEISNLAGAAIFIRFYDGTSFAPGVTPTAAQLAALTPKKRVSINSNTTIVRSASDRFTGTSFINGCFVVVTGASPDNDTTNVPANGCFVDVLYI